MAFIDAHREDLGIEPICRELAIAPSSYHEHAARRADPGRRPARTRRDEEIREQIKRVHEASFGLYGARKGWHQMRRDGITVEMATPRWVDWYNNHRLFGPIGHIPPAEAEDNYYAALENLDMAA